MSSKQYENEVRLVNTIICALKLLSQRNDLAEKWYELTLEFMKPDGQCPAEYQQITMKFNQSASSLLCFDHLNYNKVNLYALSCILLLYIFIIYYTNFKATDDPFLLFTEYMVPVGLGEDFWRSM